MKRVWKWVAVGTMVAILGIAAVGVVAYAQETTTGDSAVWDFGERVKEAIAEALGITVDKYDEVVATARQQVLEEAVASGRLTQEQADRMQERLDRSGGFGRLPAGHAPHGTSLLMMVAAEKLGITEAELSTELRSGKSIADLASEKGIDVQIISDEYLTQLKAELDAQVADGSLTQEQADAKLQDKTEALPDRLNGTMEMPAGGGRGRHGCPPGESPNASGGDDL